MSKQSRKYVWSVVLTIVKYAVTLVLGAIGGQAVM